jgi:hypothetical protein
MPRAVTRFAFSFKASSALGTLTVGHIHKVTFFARLAIVALKQIVTSLASTASPAQITLASNSTGITNGTVPTEVAERIGAQLAGGTNKG